MLPVCTSSDKAFAVGPNTATGLFSGSYGDSPAEACRNYSVSVGQQYIRSSLTNCERTDSGTGFPIIQICAVPQDHVFPPFNLDLAEAAQIAGAILIVWGTGYGIRMVIRALRHSDEGLQDGE